ncbi:MAG: nitrous oxide-stimulated promoter family protein [Spirochaetia bacterium]
MEDNRRSVREKRTVETMIGMYCRAHHGGEGDVCDECRRLLAYAIRKIDNCPFQKAKPVCAHCEVHCYPRREREQIKRVMRFAGPRMLVRHPVLALLHLGDGLRGPGRKTPG